MGTLNNATASIPDVLMDYLRNLIGADGSIQFIRLVPVKLGYGLVQEIILEMRGKVESRRLFGFTPIDTQLQVITMKMLCRHVKLLPDNYRRDFRPSESKHDATLRASSKRSIATGRRIHWRTARQGHEAEPRRLRAVK